jgi:hypothetical protein
MSPLTIGNLQDMCDRVGDRMSQRRTEDASSILSPPCVHKEWVGDDLSTRGDHIGLRAAAANLAKKLFSSDEYKDEVVDLMNSQNMDILVASEPGNSCGMTIAALRNYMIRKDMEVVIMTRGSYGIAGHGRNCSVRCTSSTLSKRIATGYSQSNLIIGYRERTTRC